MRENNFKKLDESFSESFFLNDSYEEGGKCINKTDLDIPQLERALNERNPSSKCSICDGYDEDCPDYQTR